MNKIMTILALSLVISANAFSAGTEIKSSNITNKSSVKNAGNMAITTGLGSAEANQGSIRVKGATVKDSNITNKSSVKNAGNMAITTGLGDAKANQGSIDIGG